MADATEFLASYSAALAAEVRGVWPAHWLDTYELEDCLKSSSDKMVFLAKDRRSGAELILRATDTDAGERADAEWAILSRLDHPGIPKAYGTYVGGGRSYVAREYFPGEPLDAVVARKAFTAPGVYRVAGQLAAILDYLHRQDPPVIHRDIKPQNIIVRPDGSLGLTDFGIARTFKPDSASDTKNMGTMQYAPPEQFGYAQSTPLTDIYALGIVLIYVATGSPDRQGLDQRIADPKLRAMIEKCIAFDPTQRFQSAAQLCKWLDKSQTGRKRWLLPALGTVAALAVVGVGGYFVNGAIGTSIPDAPRSASSGIPQPDPNSSPQSGPGAALDDPTAGNYPGNLVIGGFAVAGDSELYVATPEGVVALSQQGQFLRKVSDSGTASDLNFYQGKLYYLLGGNVWTHDPATGETAELRRGGAGNLWVDQGGLYFADQYDSLRLYSLSLDGKTTKKADDFTTSYYRNLVAGSEYLCVGISNSDSGCELTSLDLASGKVHRFGLTSTRWVAAWDGWLYYSEDRETQLRRVRFDGSGDELVNSDPHYFNVPAEQGVFSLNAITNTVELINPESGSVFAVTGPDAQKFNLAGDWIIYQGQSANLRMIRSDTSGDQPVPTK
ncbi:MAG: protein kinase [Propionibacteriaceae bacterium]|jgi:hypothetical protein|nr:protein kinase [Propionibacteriaceae bacterium]